MSFLNWILPYPYGIMLMTKSRGEKICKSQYYKKLKIDILRKIYQRMTDITKLLKNYMLLNSIEGISDENIILLQKTIQRKYQGQRRPAFSPIEKLILDRQRFLQSKNSINNPPALSTTEQRLRHIFKLPMYHQQVHPINTTHEPTPPQTSEPEPAQCQSYPIAQQVPQTEPTQCQSCPIPDPKCYKQELKKKIKEIEDKEEEDRKIKEQLEKENRIKMLPDIHKKLDYYRVRKNDLSRSITLDSAPFRTMIKELEDKIKVTCQLYYKELDEIIKSEREYRDKLYLICPHIKLDGVYCTLCKHRTRWAYGAN